MSIDEIADAIAEDFSWMDDWEDRYGYIIALGRKQNDCGADLCVPDNLVSNCVSKVWLDCDIDSDGRLCFRGASDATIMAGMLSLLLKLYSRRRADEILSFDADAFFARIGIDKALSSQRANGLRSIYGRIRNFAVAARGVAFTDK